MAEIDSYHFAMDICDGQCAAQVHIRDERDMEYWKSESKRTNHKMIFSYSVPKDHYMNITGVAYDVYQILPLDVEVING